MKKLLLFAFAICLFTTASYSQVSRSTVRGYWNQRLVPGFVKDSTTWAAFWNINDDGTPLVYPDSFSSVVNANDTLIIKDTAGTFKKVIVGSQHSSISSISAFNITVDSVLYDTIYGNFSQNSIFYCAMWSTGDPSNGSIGYNTSSGVYCFNKINGLEPNYFGHCSFEANNAFCEFWELTNLYFIIRLTSNATMGLAINLTVY